MNRHDEYARLIAAAPEMLDTLLDQYAFMADISHDWRDRGTISGQQRLSRMRDVIAAAAGMDPQDVQDEANRLAADHELDRQKSCPVAAAQREHYGLEYQQRMLRMMGGAL